MWTLHTEHRIIQMSVSVRIICSDSGVQTVIVTNGIVNGVVLDKEGRKKDSIIPTRHDSIPTHDVLIDWMNILINTKIKQ